MSISSMTNVAFVRRADVNLPGVAPMNAAPASAESVALSTAGTAESKSAMTATLDVIVTYIPTEVLTLYIAVLAAIQPAVTTPLPATQTPPAPSQALAAIATQPPPVHSLWVTFYCFLIATPLVVWLVYSAKVRTAGRPLPVRPKTWPMWEMFAATVGYATWAFALPNNPFKYSYDWYSSALAGVLVLIVSTILGLLAPLLQRTLPS
jgi:hypothetical protein